jgi:hypothetical protein
VPAGTCTVSPGLAVAIADATSVLEQDAARSVAASTDRAQNSSDAAATFNLNAMPARDFKVRSARNMVRSLLLYGG